MHITKYGVKNSIFNRFVWVVIAILAPLLTSCNSGTEATDAQYYDTLYDHMSRAMATSHDAVYIRQSDSILQHTKSPGAYLYFKHLELKSGYYYETGKLDAARLLMDSCAYVLESANLTEKHPMEYAHVLDARADYAFTDNDLDRAFRYYSKTRNIRLSVHDDTCALSNATYHLGMVSYRQEKYAEAAEFFKEAISEISHCSDHFTKYNRTQEEMNNIALSYTNLKEYDSALKYYTQALAFIDTGAARYTEEPILPVAKDKARGVVYGNMAKILMALGRVDTAEQLLLKSIAINSRPGFENKDAMYSNMQLAELYFQEGKADKAGALLKDLRVALDTFRNPAVNLRWHKLMYEYARRRHDLGNALVYLEKYQVLKDSAQQTIERLKKVDYGGLLKDQETQYQMSMLKKDAQLSKVYLWSTVGVVGVALIIIALVSFSYRRGRTNISKLTGLNLQVNEQKAQLEEAMVQLKESNDDKDRILRIVAHDLRTPINGIMIISDLLMQEEEDPEKRESLGMTITAAQNLLHLTNELLEFSGNARLADKGVLESVNLNELMRQTVGLLMFKAQEKKQIITFNTVPYPVVVDVYKDKISRVLSNLISNALKFSKEGALVKISLIVEEHDAIMKVEDFGIGIPDSMIDHIFEPFTPAKRHGTSGERSYGLGLSICKQIIDAHKGEIWVESKEGQGSIFYVKLHIKEGSRPATV